MHQNTHNNALGLKSKDEQRIAIDAVVGGKDVLAVLPTGFGKSFIYFAVSGITRRPAWVVSPLRSLIRDQVDGAGALGLNAAYIDGTLDKAHEKDVIRRLFRNELDVFLTTPEQLMRVEFDALFQRTNPSVVAIDEAHLISDWGGYFRPAFRGLGERIESLRWHYDTPICALTATADAQTQNDIKNVLRMKDPLEIVRSPMRNNISLSAKQSDNPLCEAVKAAVKAWHNLEGKGAILLYVLRQKDVDLAIGALMGSGVPIHHIGGYHGGMPDDKRDEMQNWFRRAEKPIMVATVAFGMGINRPDVRYVIHGSLPASVTRYLQETGRAGRDGKPAKAICFWSRNDVQTYQFLFGRRPMGWMFEKLYNAVAGGRLLKWDENDVAQVVGYQDIGVIRQLMDIATGHGLVDVVQDVPMIGVKDQHVTFNALEKLSRRDREGVFSVMRILQSDDIRSALKQAVNETDLQAIQNISAPNLKPKPSISML